MSEQEQTGAADPAEVKRRIGRVGVWTGALVAEPAANVRAYAAEVEQLGFGALWFGESPQSKEALAQSAILLGATERLIVATGIANIWSRDASAASNGASTLAEAYGQRFLLGLGVSHAPLVAAIGQEYRKPLTAMRGYLDAMDTTGYGGPLPEQAPRVLAALRPKMLELARDRTQGAHPYFVPVEHTARARAILGPDPVLAPEVAVVVDADPERARAVARDYMAAYLGLPNYVNNLRELGWTDADLADGGSDALVDAIVPWGEPAVVAARIGEHLTAGADHVCIQPLTGTAADQLARLRTLVPLLPTA